jgi:hypothetical protein
MSFYSASTNIFLMHLAFCTTTLRASPAVISILSLYTHYLTTLYLFFQINTPASTLYFT